MKRKARIPPMQYDGHMWWYTEWFDPDAKPYPLRAVRTAVSGEGESRQAIIQTEPMKV
jgi:hypothetical protein